MLESKRVAVSGGAGVIGTILVHKLLDAGARVWVGDLKHRPQSFPSTVIYRMGDLNHVTAEELQAFDPEIFIHLAATFERSTETLEFWGENFHHNVRLSNHLCSVLQKSPSLRKFVFASSYLVYDPSLYQFAGARRDPRSLTEHDTVYPRNLCGAAKFYHEAELRFLQGHLPWAFVVARIFRGYGPRSRDVISRWVRSLLRSETLDVFRSEGIFDFVYADDSAEALLRLAMSEFTGIVNVGSGAARRVSDVLDILKQHFPAMQTRLVPSDIAFEASQADIGVLHAATKWRPAFALESAIPRIIDHERATSSHSGRESGGNGAGVADDRAGILLTSVSRKVPMLEAVRAGARKIGEPYRLLGADMKTPCIGSHFVDVFWEMPPLAELSAQDVVTYCASNGVRYIVPSRDGELPFFAKGREFLERQGIAVMISTERAVEICRDKLRFAEELTTLGLCAIPTATTADGVDAERLVVKDRHGSGSLGVKLDLSREEAKAAAATIRNPVFQPFVAGTELSVDVYVDLSGKCKGAVARRRELVVHGESQVTSTLRHPSVEALCGAIAEALGIYGHAVFQVIEDEAKALHVIECNPRFGGASSLSVAAGLDTFYWFLLEARGIDLDAYPFARTACEHTQVRYPADLLLRRAE